MGAAGILAGLLGITGSMPSDIFPRYRRHTECEI
jgi:hypothetical protein